MCFPVGGGSKMAGARVVSHTLPQGIGCTLCGPDGMALKSTSPTNSTLIASVAQLIGLSAEEIEAMFVCEAWSAELATGLVQLGPETAVLHGTSCIPCGIMDLIRLYDPLDWAKVLQALEDAAMAETAFSFATTIRQDAGLYRPVFCVGRSETSDGAGGMIHGTFAVARLCIEAGTKAPAAVN